MAKRFSTLLKKLPSWFLSPSGGEDIVMGTMGRLVRNLQDVPFPGWGTSENRAAAANALLPALQSLPGFSHAYLTEIAGLGYRERRVLMERKQLTACMAARQDECYLLINNDQSCLAMVNEEEHLALHAFARGLKLEPILKRLCSLSTALGKQLPFAYSQREGYLTSMPSECGEGLQLYVVLHLPGIGLSNALAQVGKALEKLQLSISPLYPELGEESGNMYVVYTSALLLGTKEDLAAHLGHVTHGLMEQELNIRGKLMSSPGAKDFFLDQLARAYGLLRYARKLSYKEAMQALSLMRLGIGTGLFTSSSKEKGQLLADLLSLHLSTAPYRMAYQGNFSEKDWEFEPRLRADLVRQCLHESQLQSTVII